MHYSQIKKTALPSTSKELQLGWKTTNGPREAFGGARLRLLKAANYKNILLSTSPHAGKRHSFIIGQRNHHFSPCVLATSPPQSDNVSSDWKPSWLIPHPPTFLRSCDISL